MQNQKSATASLTCTHFPIAESFNILNTASMSAFLKIASRVEAAVEAYNSVWYIADRDEWKGKFKGELVSPCLHGIFNHPTFEIEKCDS